MQLIVYVALYSDGDNSYESAVYQDSKDTYDRERGIYNERYIPGPSPGKSLHLLALEGYPGER
jgi:hypothetical protein